jgi:integrase
MTENKAKPHTCDNIHLSQPTERPGPIAINCTNSMRGEGANSNEDLVAKYVDAALAPNSKRAYAADWAHFLNWGGVIPAAPEMVAAYIAEQAGLLSVATLKRRLIAIAKMHRDQGSTDPVATPLVKASMRGIKRVHGVKQKGAAPLVWDALAVATEALGVSLRDRRDRALLQLGYAAALRRSELVSLNVRDIERAESGICVHIRRSKTDPYGRGRVVVLSRSLVTEQAINALDAWLTASGISAGAVFRGISRSGRLSSMRLSGEAVSLIVKKRTRTVSELIFSGHSLRAGYVTDTASEDIPIWRIKLVTGHRSDLSVQRYIRHS